ncbi:MAG TPA: tRNA 2-thiouridine(34) synthase MnmA [Polyangiaceae bacterium]|jgi:tRNA-specific 2-thiouridylase|nr:tRNA 2-thiouridine(34) synthase MnmA [Polyangiaceae bacterium]
MQGRVLVAMSGGVDSSVAAARLVRAGWDVVGVTLHLWDYPDDGSVRGRCCAPEDVYDARRVADVLGIPHYAFDRRELFDREVVTPFVEAYLGGATPSPCVRCNRSVKMKELFALADRLEARWVATGHYARVEPGPPPRLCRARDRAKDQSYFLDSVDAKNLGRLMLPLGDATKAETRAEALALDLPGAHKGESQELCFVPTGRYDELVAKRAGERARPGAIVDETGRAVGRHDGLFRFTVGQRKNLGVATGSRAYVVRLDADTATVHLGPRDALLSGGARLGDVTLHEGVALPLRADVAVRYRAPAVPARVVANGTDVEVRFDAAVAAVTPGQRAVFYDGEAVIGAGTIVSPLHDVAVTDYAEGAP